MEEGEEDYELIKPKKRIGRPPREWSSILLPKEVTTTLGARKSRSKLSHKTDNSTNRVDNNAKISTNMVGQAVHGVVDGSFDAGFLVSLRMGDTDSLYRGVVFGPGLSIPVSKDTDIAKNVKRKRRRTIRAEPSTNPPPPPPPPTTTEKPSTNPTLIHPPPPPPPPPPPNYGASLAVSAQARDNPRINATSPPDYAHKFGYNGVFNPTNLRPPSHHPEINVNPFLHSSSFTHRPSVPLPTQGYNPAQNVGHILPPSTSAQFGYTFGSAQGRPAQAALHSHYQGPSYAS